MTQQTSFTPEQRDRVYELVQDDALEPVIMATRRNDWASGWYAATNGKWGLPDPGENPFGDCTDDDDELSL